MAEVIAGIGLAASIIAFVETSANIYARIHEFRTATKEVPKIFQDIMIQLPLMTDVMARIEKRYKAGFLTADSQIALSNVVEGCRRQITLLDSAIEKVLPASTDSSLRRVQKALASIRKEKDVALIHKTLLEYASTLTLHFSEKSEGVTYAEVTERTYYEVPSMQVSQFVERPELLREIEQGFANDIGHPSRLRIVVLLGMGGQGKTQLALEYCRLGRKSGRYKAIFWIDASSPSTASRGFEAMAAKISSPDQKLKDAELGIAFVKTTLEKWVIPWLLVFDNYDQPGEFKNISAYIPQGESGSILFTSRHADSERLGLAIKVTRMAEDEGLELLLRQSKAEVNEENKEEGRMIVQKLGYLPLAIDQAGAYINARKLPLKLFIEHYNERKEDVLKHTPSLWEYRKMLGGNTDETLLDVFTTWELSFRQIGKTEQERTMIGEFLTLSAFFNTTNVGESLFRFSALQWKRLFTIQDVWSKYKYQDIIVELMKLSLLQSMEIGKAEAFFSLHPLVTDWLKLRISQSRRQECTIQAMTIMKDYIIAEDRDGAPWQFNQYILSHVDSILRNDAEYLKGSGDSNIAFLKAAFAFAACYAKHGRYGEAEVLYHRVLAGYEIQLGRYNTLTLDTFHNLGFLYWNQGKLQEADAMYQRALSGKELVLGPDNPSTLDTVNNLGILYRSQDKLAEAEAMYLRALNGKEKVLGADHTSTLDTVNNLGILYKAQGRLAEAESMYGRALAGKDLALEKDHISTLNTVYNLGILHESYRNMAEAEEHYNRALTGYGKTLGPNHAVTVQAITRLDNLYKAQGKLAESKALNQRYSKTPQFVRPPSNPSQQYNPAYPTNSQIDLEYPQRYSRQRANPAYPRCSPIEYGPYSQQESPAYPRCSPFDYTQSQIASPAYPRYSPSGYSQEPRRQQPQQPSTAYPRYSPSEYLRQPPQQPSAAYPRYSPTGYSQQPSTAYPRYSPSEHSQEGPRQQPSAAYPRYPPADFEYSQHPRGPYEQDPNTASPYAQHPNTASPQHSWRVNPAPQPQPPYPAEPQTPNQTHP